MSIHEKCSQGEATVAFTNVNGQKVVAVGILNEKKVLAVCGLADAPDQEESVANALVIASLWNQWKANPTNLSCSIKIKN
jgi:hypothetical protein